MFGSAFSAKNSIFGALVSYTPLQLHSFFHWISPPTTFTLGNAHISTLLPCHPPTGQPRSYCEKGCTMRWIPDPTNTHNSPFLSSPTHRSASSWSIVTRVVFAMHWIRGHSCQGRVGVFLSISMSFVPPCLGSHTLKKCCLLS